MVYNSLSIAEFEQRWSDFIYKYELDKHEWLTNLYVERHMWVPCFMTDHFWAGMRSTQRVESIHSFFDQFVNPNTLLCEFGERYIAAVEKRISQEKEADDRCEKWFWNSDTEYAAELYFRHIYTSSKFRFVQWECEKVTYCMVREEKTDDSGMIQYLMEDRVWVLPEEASKPRLTKRRTMYCISYSPETQDAFCNCKMFETHGIICRHLIRVYDLLHNENYPEKYVLRRWRRDVLRKHTSIRVAFHDLSRTEEIQRLDRLTAVWEPLSDLAIKSERCTEIVLRGIERMELEVQDATREEPVVENPTNSIDQSNMPSPSGNPPSGNGVAGVNTVSPGNQSQCNNNVSVNSSPTSQTSIKDPPIPKKRGRPRTSRFKSLGESGWKSNQKTSGGTPTSTSKKVVEAKKNGKGKKGEEPQAPNAKKKGKGKRKEPDVSQTNEVWVSL